MIFINEQESEINEEMLEGLVTLAEEIGLDDDDFEANVDFDAVDPVMEMSDDELGLNEHEDWEAGDAEFIAEAALKTSRKVVIKTKQQKMAHVAQGAGMSMAKDAKDPLYKQYEKYRKLELKFRAKIEKKYKSKGKAAARAAASGLKKKKAKKK